MYVRRNAQESTSQTNEGRYANYFEIGHNALEFVLDLGQEYSDGMEKVIHTRVVTSPTYAKELMRVLEKSLTEYEQSFGVIDCPE